MFFLLHYSYDSYIIRAINSYVRVVLDNVLMKQFYIWLATAFNLLKLKTLTIYILGFSVNDCINR